jgi:hypothetical protein
LQEPGIWCFNLRAADLFAAAGAHVREHSEHGQPVWRITPRHARKAIQAGDVSEPFAFGAKDPQDFWS